MHFDTTLPYKIEVGKNILISLRRAVKILCQISGEKNTILKKKKKVETVYLSNSTFVTTKTGWLSTDHYLFPSTCYHRKQRIKINRYQKNTILIFFFSCLWIITVCSINIFLCVSDFPPSDKCKHLAASFSSYISNSQLSKSHVSYSMSASVTGADASSQNLFSYSII